MVTRIRDVQSGIIDGYTYVIRELELAPGYMPSHFCGYVKVATIPNEDEVRKLRVHGGITFQGELWPHSGVYVGFDTAHSFDDETTKNPEYVLSEIRSLIEQLKWHGVSPG